MLFAPYLAHGADDAALTPSHKAKILVAGLSFSRNLRDRGDAGFHVVTVGDCPTADELKSLEGKPVNNQALHVTRVEASNSAQLEQQLNAGAAALFYCPDGAKLAGQVTANASSHKVITVADDPGLVADHLAMVGVEVRNGRPALLLNATLAKEVGLDFDPRVYTVSRVIK